jgi:hypothetical protein
MYGSVARLQAKPGAREALIAFLRSAYSPPPPTFVGRYIYQLDSDADTLIVAAVMDSQEAWVANSLRPEIQALYPQMVAFLAREPVWDDGQVVIAGC